MSYELNLGFHASAGGNFEKIPLEVKKMGGECFQFFSRSPYGGKVSPLDAGKAEKFKENCEEAGIENYYIHAPYFINFASANNRIFYGSIGAIKEDLERAVILGAKYVVTHIGSAKDFKNENDLFSKADKTDAFPVKYQDILNKIAKDRGFSPQAFKRVVEGLNKIADNQNKIPLLIEIAAGAGAVLGVAIPEIAFYLESAPALAGFCFDTAHAFASGYDIRDRQSLSDTFGKIENYIGKEKLKLIHINDSSADYDSRVDRHAHLGKGKIGEGAFKNLMERLWKNKYNVDMILETPTKEGVIEDLKFLKSWRNK